MIGVLILMKFRARKEFRGIGIQIPHFTDILNQIQEMEFLGFQTELVAKKNRAG